MMIDNERLKILTESAKYDVSCSSSGSTRRGEGVIGNCLKGGICHSFTPDGRCISILKILMSNDCVYDCKYCVNRRSNDIKRATASPDEICELVVNFYKRNYIEGLFLSSSVVRNSDYTMERLLSTVYKLRRIYGFGGYIHLKGIPGADKTLLEKAGHLVDRMSFNLELPSEQSLKLLAPQKSKKAIVKPMFEMREDILEYGSKNGKSKFLPAGQTTQMIIGASPEKDGKILKLSEALYKKAGLKRVYYSSYVPVNLYSDLLPVKPAGLLREHRLYQADWLLRYYGFTSDEIADEGENLDVSVDPKCFWALKHPELFPVEVNTAPVEMLLRVPGIGIRSAYKIINARKHGTVGFENLSVMKVVLKRAKHFITCKGKFYGTENLTERKFLLSANEANYTQLSLFSDNENAISASIGEL